MNQNDQHRELLTFYRAGSLYDIVQEITAAGVGLAWTLSPCSVHAAEQAAWMLRRLGAKRVRHSRRARLRRSTGDSIEVMIATELPDIVQTVLRIDDGEMITISAILRDGPLS